MRKIQRRSHALATTYMTFVALVGLASGGCYTKHTRDGLGEDGSLDDEDGSIAGRPDARPPTRPTPPMIPSRCLHRQRGTVFEATEAEAGWPIPASTMVRADADQVASTPRRLSSARRIAFISHEMVNDPWILEGRGPTASLDLPDFAGASGLPPARPIFLPGLLRIVDFQTGQTWTYPSDPRALPPLDGTSSVAIGDLDGDGEEEVVAQGLHSGLYAFDAAANLKWASPYPAFRERGLRPVRSMGGRPIIADLDGDGRVEVIMGRTVIDGPTGALRWTGSVGTGRGVGFDYGGHSCVADLDGDGAKEVVAGFTAFRADGTVMWSNPSLHDGPCAVGEIDPISPGPEIVLTTRHYVRIISSADGSELRRIHMERSGAIAAGGSPILADFDGDGRLEIAASGGGSVVVYDPDCDAAAGHCRGSAVQWRQPARDHPEGAAITAFDFDGDGSAELLYADDANFRILRGSDGALLYLRCNTTVRATERPAVIDIDGDGRLEVVVGSASFGNSRESHVSPGGLTVLRHPTDAWGRAR